MDIKDIRRQNLNLLIEEKGSKHNFAIATNMNPSHVSQLANGYRNVGDKVARKIEEALGLPTYSLDQQLSNTLMSDMLFDSKKAEKDAEILAERFILKFQRFLKIKLSPYDHMKLLNRMKARYARQIQARQPLPVTEEELNSEIADFAEFATIKRD